MSITINSSFKAGPRISRAGFIAVLSRRGSFTADPLWEPTLAEKRPHEAGRIYDWIVSQDHDPAVYLAIAGKEHTWGTNTQSVLWRNRTRSWTNARSIRHPDVSGTIIRDSYRGSHYVKYNSAYDSVRDGVYRVDDPNFAYRQANANTIAEVIAIWAPADDQNDPTGYAQTMVRWINEWAKEFPVKEEEPPVSDLTTTIMNRIKAHGVEIHDIRGQLIQHATKRYQVQANTAWTHLAVHYTAGGTASPNNTRAQDIARWQAHARHHVNTQGWPGIAYAFGFSPSGRVFVLRDVRLRGFHAGNANSYALGIAGDYTRGQALTPKSLDAAAVIAHVLFHETPEFPNLKQENARGHRDFMSTDCPGDALYSWVQKLARGEVDLPRRDAPRDPCRYFTQTRHYLCHGFRGYWESRPDSLQQHGYPISEEFDMEMPDGRKITVQYFERARYEWQPNIADNPHGVVLGRIGSESIDDLKKRYPEAFEPQDPPK